jgi:hypothetical protein
MVYCHISRKQSSIMGTLRRIVSSMALTAQSTRSPSQRVIQSGIIHFVVLYERRGSLSGVQEIEDGNAALPLGMSKTGAMAADSLSAKSTTSPECKS